MTTIELLMLIQTIVGLLTLLALIWYACETRRIRLDAAQQNDLILRQVELAHKMFGLEAEKEASANEPVFQWQGGGSGPGLNVFTYNFKNGGAAVQHVSAEAEDGAKLQITSSLDAGTAGHVDLNPNRAQEPARFKIHYTTKQQKKRTKFFSVRWGENPTEIPPF
jgi:hypothetical protein